MAKKNHPIFSQISQFLVERINALYPEAGITVSDIEANLSTPPNLKLGHIAFACFPLAKACKKAPPMIATEICKDFESTDVIQSAAPAGPYINFLLKSEGMGKYWIETILDGSFAQGPFVDSTEKVMIEYSQPNTHKILHVGHMRNLCLGNALININRYAGFNTLAVTYPGDVGTHVAKTLWYFKYHNQEAVPATDKGAWLGDIYTKANTKLEDEKGSEKEDQNRKELTEILKQLHDQNGEFYDLWVETKKWSVQLMEETYDWAGVKFDRWFWESEVDAPSLKYVNELFDKGVLVKDAGAIGMDLSEDGLGFCLLVKTDGTGLYATKDVELAKVKFEEFKVDKNIYIVDNRQAHHFRQVFKVLEKVGFEKAKDCFHLEYAMVELPDGAMSSRKGNIVPLKDLVDQMENAIVEQYLAKYREDNSWTEDEIQKTASMIANGAIKYGMTKVDNNRKIVFNMNEWLKLDGDTGPYLQYVHARISSLCSKINLDKNLIDWSTMQKDQEIALAVKLLHFNQIVASSAVQLKTINLCSYLFDLGKLFNSFYAECSIAKAENEKLKNTRLALSMACAKVMKQGLELLGIPAPEKM